jgi:hypothetical protein
LRHLHIKCIVLPRQAWDKHRDPPKKTFSLGVEDLALYIVSHFESVIDISAFTDGERATESALTCLVLRAIDSLWFKKRTTVVAA